VLAGRFCSVPSCVVLGCCRPSYRGVHGRIADGIRAASTVGVTAGFSTDGHGRAALGARSGLTYEAGSGLSPAPTPRQLEFVTDRLEIMLGWTEAIASLYLGGSSMASQIIRMRDAS